MSLSYRAIASINLAALTRNILQIKQLAPKSKIVAVVKDNAYGHGAVQIALTIQDKVDALGVMFIDEAIQLRNAAVTIPLVVMCGFFNEAELHQIADYKLDTVIHNVNQVKILKNSKLKNKVNVWLEINSGLHRLGISFADVQPIYEILQTSPNVLNPIRFTTHFSDADEINKPKTMEQFADFAKCIAGIDGELCVSNSAAILNYPQLNLDWVRPGITLYGVSPLSSKTTVDLGLRPVMTLSSGIINIHHLKKGDTVGYGSEWVCPEDMVVGIVAIGYGDGYPRNACTGTPVLVKGKECQLIGRVAMDMINVDLRNCPDAKICDRVELWGERLPITKVAACANTISYELFCRINQRMRFEYLNF
jgi:alanine racemase